MGDQERRVGFEIRMDADGWIKVLKGVFPLYGVSGRKRVLFRLSDDAEGVVLIDHRLDGVLTLEDPYHVFAGQQIKIEDISAA